MELIYLYIHEFNDKTLEKNNIIRKQEINFSPNFDVKIENKKLIINNKKSYIHNLYPSNIKNITMLLGKNGSGKTTIMDILGMNGDDRCRESIKRKGRSKTEITDSYFILYHIEGDYFGVEVMDGIGSKDKITKLFKGTVTNIEFNKFITRDPFYKIPIGLVLKKEDDKFQAISHLFDSSFLQVGYKVSDRIRISYIFNKYSDRINTRYNRIGKDEDGYEKDDYYFKRRYYLTPSKERQYIFVNDLNCKNDLRFCGDLATVEITPDFDYALDSITNDEQKKENDKMERWIDSLEKNLYMDTSERINIFKLLEDESADEEIKSKEKIKQIFIKDTLSSYIIHQFIQGICKMIDENRGKNNSNQQSETEFSKTENNLTDEEREFLNSLKKDEYRQSNSNNIFGSLSDKNKEYEKLLNVITYYKKDEELEVYKHLICISRYLYSRMESVIGLGSDSRYQIAIEDFLNALNNLEASYFNKKNILIKCNSQMDDKVIKAFQIYDSYLNSEYSDIRMRFKIKFINLSEGENNLLDLLSKIFDIVKTTRDNQLSIILLDEPDQSLHPEWSRQFIQFICKELKKYKNKNLQIVMSTHSPFMASDIMAEHIYRLENIRYLKEENKQESKIIIRPMKDDKHKIYNTFGANIYEILKDSFILQRTIGEFSYKKIEELIKNLKDNSSDKNIDIEYEKFLIDSIGELPLRKKLMDMHRKKRQECYSLKNELLKKLKVETDKDKLKQIQQIFNEG